MHIVTKTLLSKQSVNYDLYGVTKKPNPEETMLFAAASSSIPCTIGDIPQVLTGVDSQQIANNNPSKCCDICPEDFITKCLSQVCIIDMLLENFIASVVTTAQHVQNPKVLRGMLAPIFISTVCMIYAQYALIIKGFIAARTGNAALGPNNMQHVTLKNQLQALAGFISSSVEGVRFFFNMMVVFERQSIPLGYIVGSMAGAGKFGSFLMAKGHSACDSLYSQTWTGKAVYGALTAPISPDFIKYVTSIMPIVGGIMHFAAVTTVRDIFEIKNQVLVAFLYTAAFFGSMLGFLLQKCYICDVIKKNFNKNLDSVDAWNSFWYGDNNDANIAQKLSFAIKRFTDIVMAIPITAVDATEKLMSATCYFIFAMLPIQLFALFFYITNTSLTYCVFFQIFNNSQLLLDGYFDKNTDPLSKKDQYLLTAASVPFGLASAFTLMHLTYSNILKETNDIYKVTPISVDSASQPGVDAAVTLISTENQQSNPGILGRLSKVGSYCISALTEIRDTFFNQLRSNNKRA